MKLLTKRLFFLHLTPTLVGSIIFILSTVSESSARDILISWDPVTNHPVAGYKVYYKEWPFCLPMSGTGAVQGNSPINVGENATYVLNGLMSNTTYYIATSTYSTYGIESPLSEILEVSSTNVISSVLSLADLNISTALDRLPSGNNLKIMANDMEYVEDVNISRCGDTITLNGGYDSYYRSLNGYTIINGYLNIICGTMVVDRVIIR